SKHLATSLHSQQTIPASSRIHHPKSPFSFPFSSVHSPVHNTKNQSESPFATTQLIQHRNHKAIKNREQGKEKRESRWLQEQRTAVASRARQTGTCGGGLEQPKASGEEETTVHRRRSCLHDLTKKEGGRCDLAKGDEGRVERRRKP
ncbi:hypothetical protein V8G54_008624, partial [Vigna mungo]